MKVELDGGEMAVAQMLAAMRYGVARQSGVRNQRVGKQSDYQTDLDGIVAELAFAKWKNVCPDLSVGPRCGGVDAVVKGMTVDIKATRYRAGHLLATKAKSEKEGAEVYILAIVDDNAVDFVGWAWAKDLLVPERLKDLGHGQGYAMKQDELKSFA